MGTVSVVQLAADVLTVAKLLPSRVLASRSTSAQTTRLARELATPRFFVVAPRGVVGRGSPDHAARVRWPAAAGHHPGTRLPPPRGGNGPGDPLPTTPRGATTSPAQAYPIDTH